jgi:hypothetical protein
MALPRQEARLARRKQKRVPRTGIRWPLLHGILEPQAYNCNHLGTEKARFRKEESVI